MQHPVAAAANALCRLLHQCSVAAHQGQIERQKPFQGNDASFQAQPINHDGVCRQAAVKAKASDSQSTGPRGVVVRTKTLRPATAESASALIDAKVKELNDWRGDMLSRLRALVRQAVPEVIEEWKWRGTPVWSHNGIICTGETYQKVVKMTFAKGAALADPSRLFNASLDGNVRRAIDFHEGARLDEPALKALIRAAVAANLSRVRAKSK